MPLTEFTLAARPMINTRFQVFEQITDAVVFYPRGGVRHDNHTNWDDSKHFRVREKFIAAARCAGFVPVCCMRWLCLSVSESYKIY